MDNQETNGCKTPELVIADIDGLTVYACDNTNQLTDANRPGSLPDERATGTVRKYAWDYHNRLIGVSDRTGTTVNQQVTYTYDVTNQRIAKATDSTTTRLVYDRSKPPDCDIAFIQIMINQ